MPFNSIRPDGNVGPNSINDFELQELDNANRRKSGQAKPRNRNRVRPYDSSSAHSSTSHISGPHLAEYTPLLGHHSVSATTGLFTGATLAVGAAVAGVVGAIPNLYKRTKEKGLVLPNSEFIGPGNPVPIGAARTEQDQIAKDHDLAYKRKHSTLEEHSQYIHDVDETAIKKFKKIDHWQAKVGALGLQAKVAVESRLGRPLYPSFGGNYMVFFYLF